MSQITYGSVGAPPGNRRGHPVHPFVAALKLSPGFGTESDGGLAVGASALGIESK